MNFPLADQLLPDRDIPSITASRQAIGASLFLHPAVDPQEALPSLPLPAEAPTTILDLAGCVFTVSIATGNLTPHPWRYGLISCR